MSEYISIDADGIGVSMWELVDLLEIVIGDLEDNGEWEGRRKLTISALYIISDYLTILADRQNEVVARIRELEREAAHDD